MNEQEVEFREIVRVLFNEKIKILVFTFLVSLMLVLYTISMPNVYESEALLIPNANQQNSSSINGLAGKLGGLASLTGINFGAQGTNKVQYAVKVLTSRSFLYDFIHKENLKPSLMASTGWNAAEDRIIYDDSRYDIDSNSWLGQENSSEEPSLYETYVKFLNENFSVSFDEKAGVLRLSVKHFSPSYAKYLVDKIILGINKEIKTRDIGSAKKNIEYLEKELATTSNAEFRQMFYQLIEQQHRQLMLARVEVDYVFETVDPAIVPEKKIGPKRAIICIVGFVFSFIFASTFVIAKNFYSSRSD